MYSAEVSLIHLEKSEEAIDTYLKRFQTILLGKNLLYINLLQSIITKLIRLLKSKMINNNSSTSSSNNNSRSTIAAV